MRCLIPTLAAGLACVALTTSAQTCTPMITDLSTTFDATAHHVELLFDAATNTAYSVGDNKVMTFDYTTTTGPSFATTTIAGGGGSPPPQSMGSQTMFTAYGAIMSPTKMYISKDQNVLMTVNLGANEIYYGTEAAAGGNASPACLEGNGAAAQLSDPRGLAWIDPAKSEFLVAMSTCNRLVSIGHASPYTMTFRIGGGTASDLAGFGVNAQMAGPLALASYGNKIYTGSSTNTVIGAVTPSNNWEYAIISGTSGVSTTTDAAPFDSTFRLSTVAIHAVTVTSNCWLVLSNWYGKEAFMIAPQGDNIGYLVNGLTGLSNMHDWLTIDPAGNMWIAKMNMMSQTMGKHSITYGASCAMPNNGACLNNGNVTKTHTYDPFGMPPPTPAPPQTPVPPQTPAPPQTPVPTAGGSSSFGGSTTEGSAGGSGGSGPGGSPATSEHSIGNGPAPTVGATPQPTSATCSLQFPSRVAPHVAISGTSVTVPVSVVSGCGQTSAFTVKLVDPNAPPWTAGDDVGYSGTTNVGYSWNHRHLLHDSRNLQAGTSSIGGATTSDNVAITPYCRVNDTTFDVTFVSATENIVVGQLYCVHAFPTAYQQGPLSYEQGSRILRSTLPTKMNVWLSTTSTVVLAHTLLAAYSNWDMTIGASLAGNGQLSGDAAFGAADLNFNSFQSAANLLVDGTTEFSGCDGFSTSSFTFGVSTGLFIVGGAYQRTPTCATTNGATAIAALLAVTDVIVADASTDALALTTASTQTFTLGYPDHSATAVRVTLERYAINRFERTATVCGTTGSTSLTTIPAQGSMIKATMLEARRFYFNGVCGITECCVGNKCSADVATDGRSCVLPRTTRNGIQVGVTLKRGTESFYVHVYMDFGWGSDGLWGSTHSWGPNPLTDNAAGTQVQFYRQTSARNYCMQLTCIPSTASLSSGGITAYSAAVCPTNADWTMPWWMTKYGGYNSAYAWTYYYYTVYGWAKQSTNAATDYTATFQRPATQSTCGCSAIGISHWTNWAITFPATTRPFVGAVTAAADQTQYVTKSMQISRISPVPTSATAAERHAFCTCWAQGDTTNPVVTLRAGVCRNCFKCPASLGPNTVLPRGFWRIWSWGSNWYNRYHGEQGKPSEVCFRANGNMQTGSHPWSRRCCYKSFGNTTTLNYINQYPSTMQVSRGWGGWPDVYTERLFSYVADRNPEQVCCRYGGGMASTDATCRLYRDRRDVSLATTSPFTTPRGCAATWTPQPPRGWGRGDPYCTTMDGAGFECNFWGEALWTSCQGWKVHTAAKPVSVGAKATIIVAIAVSEGNETVVIQRNNDTGDSEFRVNGEVQTEEFSGLYLTVDLDQTSKNLTIIRVTSIAGQHTAEVETLTASLTLSVAPDASCIGTCSGLMGNCDGDATNDIKSLDGTVSLPGTATGDAIFHNVVVSYLINNTANSLFDYPVSVPTSFMPHPFDYPTGPWVPKFVSATTMSSCPTTCNGDAGCCLDNEVAGPSFAAETVTTVATINEAKNTSVPLTGYNWPPTVTMNPNVAVLTGLSITQTISAYDADGVSTLTIDACTAADVTCTRDTTASATTSSYTLTSTVTRDFTITVTAKDAKGATIVSYMTVSALPAPTMPATSVAFFFTVPGSGFTPANVYEARLFLARDLAAIVNTFWNLAARRQTAPAFTAASHFTVSSVSAVSTGVKVNVYIAGDTLAEANARLSALNAQTALVLTETVNALTQFSTTATTSTATTTGSTATSTGVATSTMTSGTTGGSAVAGGSAAGSASTATGGNSGASALTSLLVAVASILALF